MTQQDIVNELNKIVVGYNITWDSIKSDVDRAIMRINSYLGAEYPMMSQIMLSPKHRYTIAKGGIDYPIFPERYILTVVIPFVATEILARDEEFTTIYNKYVVDFENGLFDMFQNEYNKVPVVFRQDADIGVFFGPDTPLHKNKDYKLPDFSFNVYYHFNFDYTPVEKFNVDTKKYPYGSYALIQDSNVKSFISGIYCYKFKGWGTESVAPTKLYEIVDKDGDGNIDAVAIQMVGDLHLYAQWEKECILNVTDGVVTIKDGYTSVQYLDIPIYVEGKLVRKIPTDFDKDSKLIYVKLPQCKLTIAESAFTKVEVLTLPAYDYLREFPEVTIEAGAINAPINHLYIPYSVKTIGSKGIGKNVGYVSAEIPEHPEKGWAEDFYEGEVEWGVSNG